MELHTSGRIRSLGFALPAALLALVLLGVIATGGFFLAHQEMRLGVATERGINAFYLAERGAAQVMALQDREALADLGTWDSLHVQATVDEGDWSVDVTRTADRLFLLDATGTVSTGAGAYGQASREVGVMARLVYPSIGIAAALTTVGDLTVGGSSAIFGSDSVPSGWSGECDPPGPTLPGVLIDSLTNVSEEGGAHDVEGNPPIAEDNTLTGDSLLNFGDQEWADLTSLASVVLSPNAEITQLYPDSIVVGGEYVCDTGNMLNWGDPYHPTGACGDYFPVIYAQGDLLIDANDYGQGILLVEGDLTVKGGVEFYGPVIVRGTLLTEGTGGHFNGGVIAANVSLNTTSVLGSAVVQYSSCAVERAVLNSALTSLRGLSSRSWVDLSAVGAP